MNPIAAIPMRRLWSWQLDSDEAEAQRQECPLAHDVMLGRTASIFRARLPKDDPQFTPYSYWQVKEDRLWEELRERNHRASLRRKQERVETWAKAWIGARCA